MTRRFFIDILSMHCIVSCTTKLFEMCFQRYKAIVHPECLTRGVQRSKRHHSAINQLPVTALYMQRHQISNMCFNTIKTYDCQHSEETTTCCHQQSQRKVKCLPEDCPVFYIGRFLWSINLCPKCRSRVPNYAYLRGRLQEYDGHWRTVNWQKEAREEAIE